MKDTETFTEEEFKTILEKEGIEILNFWMKEVIDIGNDMIYGQVNDDNSKVPEAPISGILITRLVWTFSKAYQNYRRDIYLQYAEYCYNYLIERFWDHKYAGIYWEAAPDGEIIDTRKQLYVQAFAVYALSAFYSATQFEDALEKAHYLYGLIETNGRDPEHGGYHEACHRDWTIAENLVLSSKEECSQKTMNTHLHIMEAYAQLLKIEHKAAHPETTTVRNSTKQLVTFLINKIYDKNTQHLNLYFTNKWLVTKHEYSPGHDIEAAWLLLEAMHILQQTFDGSKIPVEEQTLAKEVNETALKLIETTYKTGMRENGSLITEYPAEKEHTDFKDKNKLSEWWPQAEAWTGFLEAYTLTKNEKYFIAAQKAFNWTTTTLKDHNNSEYHTGLNPDGSLSQKGKAGFWKGPYHSWRACFEGAKRLQALL